MPAASQPPLPDPAAQEIAAAKRTSPTILVLMGVSGSGKSTVAQELQRVLGWPFQEGDDLHPPANIEKMRSGQPLNDQDRLPGCKRSGAGSTSAWRRISRASSPVPT